MNECHEPLRLRDIASHPMSVGFPKGHPRMETFLGTPIRHLDSHFDNIYLTEKEGRQEFTSEDEHTLVLFASQTAMVIANARRYMEEHQAKANLEALVSTSPVGVLVFDAKTLDVVSLNQETRRIVGGMNGAGRSLPHPLKVMTFRRPDGREFSPDELPPLRNDETVRAEEIVIQLPDGQSVTTLVNSTPIFSEDGEITSVVAALQDMTPLEELERIRSEFLGMVSHERRPQLTAIKGSAAAVLSASSAMNDSEMRQSFQIVDEQADPMRGLISDLLGVTRIEAGTLSITPEPTALASLIEQARSGFLREGARNRIDMDLAPDLPRVRADRQRIVQVLNNLFSNASKYSPDGSAIRVSASAEDVYVSISVSDEGRGISAESLPHIFKKFSRLDSEYLDRHTEGDDLGLAICKGIVEAHGGRIWAESGGQGLGARLTFTISAVEEAVNGSGPRPGRLAADSGPKAGPRTRILVVDDEPQVLRLVRNTLSEADYTPIATGNPDDVECLVEAEKPDLVLLDLVMPGTDGLELMERILEIADLPVIFLSGYNRHQDVVRAFESGSDDYIVKPFSPTELVARIKAVLRRHAATSRTRNRKPYLLGDLTIDYSEHRVTVAGRPAQLTATEYKLLCELSMNAGRALTHDHLLRRVWGPDYSGDPRLLRSFVKKRRHKLSDDADSPTYILTEPRVGYRMAMSGSPRAGHGD